jgi:hypothetical protein
MNKLILGLALIVASCSSPAAEVEPKVVFANTLCPITGEPIDPSIEPLEMGPVKLGFHSRNCRAVFKMLPPAQQAQKLSAVAK